MSDQYINYSNDLADRGREILVISVDIGDGRAGEIRIYEFDVPRKLAKDFCLKHDLPENVQEVLTSHIVENIDTLIKEEKTLYKNTSNFSPSKNNNQQSKYKDSTNLNFEKPKINQKSKQILSGSKSSSSLSVHDRLHEQGITSVKSKEENEIKNINKLYKTKNEMESWKRVPLDKKMNYGEKLHKRGIDDKYAKTEKMRLQQDYYERKELMDIIDIPKIKTDNTHQKLLDRQKQEFNLDKLANEGKEKVKRRENMLVDNIKQEKALQSYKPNLSKRTKEICKTNKKKDVFKNLYSNASDRRDRVTNIQNKFMHKDCTFQPNKTDNNANSGIDSTVLCEKLFKDSEVKKERLKTLMNDQLSKEKETLTFSPKIENTSTTEVSTITNRFEYLYNLREEKEKKKKEEEVKQQQEMYDNVNKSKNICGDITNKQYDSYLKNNYYKTVFMALDDDNDGVISAESINKEAVDNKTQKIINELLGSMEETGGTLDLDQFTESMEHQFRTHNDPSAKYKLPKNNEGFIEKRKNQQLKDVKMEIKDKPHIINKTFSAFTVDDGHGFINRLSQSKNLLQQQRMQAKDEQNVKEMEKCTFTPSINNNIPKEGIVSTLTQKANLSKEYDNNKKTPLLQRDILI